MDCDTTDGNGVNIDGCSLGIAKGYLISEWATGYHWVTEGDLDGNDEYDFEVGLERQNPPSDMGPFTTPLVLFNRWEVSPSLDEVDSGDYSLSGTFTAENPTRAVKAIFREHGMQVDTALPDGRNYLLPGEELKDFVGDASFLHELPDTVEVPGPFGTVVPGVIPYTVTPVDSGDPNIQLVDVDVSVSKKYTSYVNPAVARKQLSAYLAKCRDGYL